MSAWASALISALMSVVVVFVSYFLASRSDSKKTEQAERQALNASYLNPPRAVLARSAAFADGTVTAQ
jgi:preprotein translocase subunit YajC